MYLNAMSASVTASDGGTSVCHGAIVGASNADAVMSVNMVPLSVSVMLMPL